MQLTNDQLLAARVEILSGMLNDQINKSAEAQAMVQAQAREIARLNALVEELTPKESQEGVETEDQTA